MTKNHLEELNADLQAAGNNITEALDMGIDKNLRNKVDAEIEAAGGLENALANGGTGEPAKTEAAGQKFDILPKDRLRFEQNKLRAIREAMLVIRGLLENGVLDQNKKVTIAELLATLENSEKDLIREIINKKDEDEDGDEIQT